MGFGYLSWQKAPTQCSVVLCRAGWGIFHCFLMILTIDFVQSLTIKAGGSWMEFSARTVPRK